MAFCGCLILLVHCASLCDRRLQVGEVEREVEYRIVLPCTSMLASACHLHTTYSASKLFDFLWLTTHTTFLYFSVCNKFELVHFAMSSAAARAEARRKAILSRGTDRLSKLTSSARGEDNPVYLHNGMNNKCFWLRREITLLFHDRAASTENFYDRKFCRR